MDCPSVDDIIGAVQEYNANDAWRHSDKIMAEISGGFAYKLGVDRALRFEEYVSYVGTVAHWGGISQLDCPKEDAPG